jgi:peptide/nickel transport system permease protein
MRGVPKIPLTILFILFAMAILADFLPLHNPEIGEPRQRLLPPCWEEGGTTRYLLGTDTMGRDILTRIIYGARVSLLVAFAAVILSAVLGTVVGIVTGFLGGWVDQLVMRFLDAWLSFPPIIFAILMSVIVGPGTFNIVIIMALLFWARYARLVRGETLSLKSRDFVQLATVAGCSKFRIMRRHILPNVMNTVITFASLQIGMVVVVEASLTFLGVDVPPPKPAWGLMLSEGKSGLFTGQWWLIVLPGIAISMLVMSFNLLGDWLRRRLDPHLQDLKG